MTKRFVMIVLLVAAIAVAPICTSNSVFSVFGQNQDGGIGGLKGPARTKYEATLEEWRGILKTLQQLRVRFNEADISEVNGIKKEWEDAITRGNELIPQLRDDHENQKSLRQKETKKRHKERKLTVADLAKMTEEADKELTQTGGD